MPVAAKAALALSLVLTLVLSSSPVPAAAEPCVDTEEAALLSLINDYRGRNGAAPLVLSRSLTNAADAHSTDMAQNNYFSHFDRSGRSPSERAAASGYGSPVSENLAAGSSSAANTFEQWRTSTDGHNENMLDASHRVIGLGRAYGPSSTYRWYWAAMFGNQVVPGDGEVANCESAPRPANDNFASAQALDGASGDVVGSNVGATKETGEPNHSGTAGGASVWFRWTAPAGGPVTIATAGSTFDTLLAVYTGATVSGLTPVASNDDVGGPFRAV